MRAIMLFTLILLSSCTRREGSDNHTEFASGTTGTIGKPSGAAGAAKLMPFKAMTTDVEVLQGDPDAVGKPFVIRIRELPGTIVPPHSHPVDEHITIVSGTWHFGLGERFDAGKLTPLPTGSYAYAPKGSTMFAYAPEGVVVQVHGVGPFHINWRYPAATLDDQGSDKIFRYRRSERVTTSRGEGVIRQGYASGPLIQYEVVTDMNGRFMTQERDVRPVSS